MCGKIGINWLIYSDNNLLFYDNRTVLERFTSPNYNDVDNKFVKSIIRGNLNKKLFLPGTSSHVPEKRVIICNSEGKRLKYHDRFSVKPPLFKSAYLMHYNTNSENLINNKYDTKTNKIPKNTQEKKRESSFEMIANIFGSFNDLPDLEKETSRK